jgi:hypothetical protein
VFTVSAFQKALVSQGNWYEINAYGANLFLLFGLFLLVFGWLSQGFAPPPASPWAPVVMVPPLPAIFPVLALIKAAARRLQDK